MNLVVFSGKLTAQPELKQLPSGSSVVSFSLASNRKFKNSAGELVEQVEFGNCVLFGKSAEALAQYAVKGQTISVTGRMQTRNWEDKETGKKMYKTEIICDTFEFGQKPLANGGGRQNNNAQADEWGEFQDLVDGDINLEDIPF